MLIALIFACIVDNEPGDNGTCGVEGWFYYDADDDGHGSIDEGIRACSAPAGYRESADDCDDLDPRTSPAATESCNGRDDDCDGDIDEGAAGASPWYPDADADGYGASTGAVSGCDRPDGYSSNADDCDDLDGAIFPGAVEFCNGKDDDCDGDLDGDAIDPSTYYADSDGDGHGDAAVSIAACEAPVGYVSADDDCDDSDTSFHPDADESDCTDPADYNCDGTTGYFDGDADGFAACADCDDADAAQSPAAPELCNAEDDDCDGDIDEDAIDPSTWYADADGDTFGDSTATTLSCAQPAGFVADDADCDDDSASVSPDGVETCDGEDDDCDGETDEGAVDATTWYLDSDGDAYGDSSISVAACSAPSAYVANEDDCDDSTAAVNPSATEVCDGAVDEDCDGLVDDDDAGVDTGTMSIFFADVDNDGFGDPSAGVAACSAPAGYVIDGTDCNDSDAGVYPGSGC